MKTIVIDTNFLLIPAQFGVDIFAEIERICLFPHELAVADGTLAELKSLSEGNSRDARAAKMALKLLETRKIRVLRSQKVFKGVDDFLVEFASRGDVLVATMDKELQKRVKAPLIVMRAKNYLELK